MTRVAEGLGVDTPITAEFYKLLLYDEGSFFIDHRDTEKTPGMFATLVIALPSSFVGGELVVRHKGREVRLDLRCDDPAEAAFAAFYADCVHEVLPVTAGCRLTLVYNLVRRGRGRPPEAPDYAAEQARGAALLQAWCTARKRRPGDATPEKLVYPLEHAYTSAELGFAALKGCRCRRGRRARRHRAESAVRPASGPARRSRKAVPPSIPGAMDRAGGDGDDGTQRRMSSRPARSSTDT